MSNEEALEKIRKIEALLKELKKDFCDHEIRCGDCYGFRNSSKCDEWSHGSAHCAKCNKWFNEWFCPDSSTGFCVYVSTESCEFCGLPEERK
jgi:hypothetical protein